MPKLRWPTIEEWGLIVVGAAAVAIIAFSCLVAYGNMERVSKSLEDAGRAQEQEAGSHRHR